MRHKQYLDNNLADLTGQVIVITGANSGLGFEASRFLAYKGATIVMACRNRSKAEEAKRKLLIEFPSGRFNIMEYDQSSFASIDHFISELKQTFPRINALVCNAGIYLPRGDADMAPGLKLTLGTNFIGLYYLLRQITPYLDQPGSPTRILFVSSLSAYHQKNQTFAKMRRSQGLFAQYANSKLAINHLFHVLANGMNLHDFQDRKNLSFYLMHPGVTPTNIIHNFPRWFQRLASSFMHVFFHRVDTASLGIAYLAGAPHVFNGAYYVPGGLFEISGLPMKRPFPKRMVRGSGQFIYDVGKFVAGLEK